MVTQEKAESLLRELKRKATNEVFLWENNLAKNELIVSVQDEKLQFVLTLKRNPFEIKLHFRTKDRDVGLMRVDNTPYHANPDGTEVRGPHLHYYVEGEELNYAKPIGWYDSLKPVDTLYRFLKEINTQKFSVQMELF